MKNRKLKEGLNRHDLSGYVNNTFTIDKYKSKMGEDSEIAVIGFKVLEKYPAIDLMEFIEKGYKFILDADMSSGEEFNGEYQVFVEIERTPNLAKQLSTLLDGVGQLCNCYDWKFKYQKSKDFPFSEETVLEQVPLTSEAYKNKLLEIKNKDVNKFFNKGATDGVTVESDNSMTFKKPFFGDLSMKLVAIGKYNKVKNIIPGPLSLDENSQSQVYFLQKYLGDYDITKIGDKFLIKNGNDAVIVEKHRW